MLVWGSLRLAPIIHLFMYSRSLDMSVTGVVLVGKSVWWLMGKRRFMSCYTEAQEATALVFPYTYTQGLFRYSDVMYKSKSFEINCWKHYTSDSQTPNGGFRLDNQLCPHCLLHIQLAEGGGAALFDLHKTHSSKFNGKTGLSWLALNHITCAICSYMCITDFPAAVWQSHHWLCSDIDPLGLGLGCQWKHWSANLAHACQSTPTAKHRLQYYWQYHIPNCMV